MHIKAGILGGGQLGTMLIRSGIDFGITLSVLDADPDAPCSRYTSTFVHGDPLDYNTVMSFGRSLDVLTIEKEAVNTQALRALREAGVRVHPSPEVIEVIQNKLTQKRYLQSHGIPVVNGIEILDRADLKSKVFPFPKCLKKCTSGYDGKGVMILESAGDIDTAFNEQCVLEDLVEIECELSVLAARDSKGRTVCYEPVQMIVNQSRMLLDYQICPSSLPEELLREAGRIAADCAECLDLVGLVAVEMFVTKEGKLLVNEMSPRPHNSGHHTIETCATSQYEQIMRILLNLPLGNAKTMLSSVMLNLVGPTQPTGTDINTALTAVLQAHNAHIHWYGKAAKPGRKLGHITVTGQSIADAVSKAEEIREIIRSQYGED